MLALAPRPAPSSRTSNRRVSARACVVSWSWCTGGARPARSSFATRVGGAEENPVHLA